MPKLSKKLQKKLIQKSKNLQGKHKRTAHDLFCELDQLAGMAQSVTTALRRITTELCTTGLADCGPVTESNDDIPF